MSRSNLTARLSKQEKVDKFIARVNNLPAITIYQNIQIQISNVGAGKEGDTPYLAFTLTLTHPTRGTITEDFRIINPPTMVPTGKIITQTEIGPDGNEITIEVEEMREDIIKAFIAIAKEQVINLITTHSKPSERIE